MLGRGLSALLSDTPATPSEQILDVDIDLIEPNSLQPRTNFDEERLEELAQSIRANGIIQPILVRRRGGRYQLIAGERRWRAANLAGLREVPCIELDIDEKAIAEIALIENMQRKDLTVWEEADGLAALAETFGYTHEEIAGLMQKTPSFSKSQLARGGRRLRP